MFNLLDAVADHPRRQWMPLLGFGFQFAALSAMLVLPLLYPQGLPEAFREHRVFLPVPSNPSSMPIVHDGGNLGQGVRINGLVVVSRPFTFHAQPAPNAPDDGIAPPIDGQLLQSLGGNPVPRSVLDSVLLALPPTRPTGHRSAPRGRCKPICCIGLRRNTRPPLDRWEFKAA
jgi:hypothetical protein